MARYYITDFFRWEQPLIDQLRREGKFVYALRSADTGGGFSICHRVYVNREGFIITDEELPLEKGIFGDFLNDNDFYALKWTEDYTLKGTKKDISAEIEKSKQECEKKEKEEDLKWKQYIPFYKLSLGMTNKYKFHNYVRHSKIAYHLANYGKKWKTTPYYEDGKEIVLQYIRIEPETPENEMQISYFMLQNDEMITQSKRITVKRNCRISTIFKAIEKTEGLVRV